MPSALTVGKQVTATGWAEGKCGSATKGRCEQSTYRTHLEHLVWVTRVGLHYWAPKDIFYLRSLLSRPGDTDDLPNT